MNEQQVREIAETAFKTHFGDVDVVCVNIKSGFDHCDDPMVEVKIIYDGKFEQIDGEGILRVQSEVVDRVWGVEDSPGWPYLHFIARSDLGRRDPATV